MKSIYTYNDFRQYLKDHYLEMKSNDQWFSYQKFSQLAELKSPNYLKVIIDGKRDLTVSNIHQFAKALKLSETESDFFESLVLYNQSCKKAEKSFYRRRLQKIRSSKIESQQKVKIKNLSQFPLLPALVVASVGLPAETAPQILAGRFAMSPDQVKKTLFLLEKEKIIFIKEESYHLTQDYFIQFDHLKSNSDQKKFLHAHLDIAKAYLESRYSIDAQFFAHTFSASLDRMPGITKKLADLLEEITNESNEDPPERIFQMNIQFFPLDRASPPS